MAPIFHITLSIGGIACLLALMYGLFLAFNRSEQFLSLLDDVQNTLKGKILAGLFLIGWSVFVFCGSKGILDGIPDWIGRNDEDGIFHPIKDTLAGFITFFSLTVIGILEKISRDKVRLNHLELYNSELDSIIEEISSLPYKIESYNELINSSEHDKQWVYTRLLQRSKYLDKRINARVKNALNEQSRTLD